MADSLDQNYLDAIKGMEGFTPRATWDYAQHSNGYGTRAAYPGEVIDRDTADSRFQDEIYKASQSVDKAFPNLPAGHRAALTSLTYNAGPGWINGGLGDAIRSGDWDRARSTFLQYNRAGGQTLPGLVSRRQQEASWFNGETPQPQPAMALQPATGSPPGLPSLDAAALGAQSSPAGIPLFASQPQQQASIGNLLAALGGSGIQPQAPQPPQMQPMPSMQLRPPQVNYSGLQALLRGQKGFA